MVKDLQMLKELQEKEQFAEKERMEGKQQIDLLRVQLSKKDAIVEELENQLEEMRTKITEMVTAL